MSVALLIEEVNGKEINEYVPVATQESYLNNWKPISDKSNFGWIPLFESGGTFTEDDLPFILEELHKFKLLCEKETSSEFVTINTRVTLLISKLENLSGKKVVFTIG